MATSDPDLNKIGQKFKNLKKISPAHVMETICAKYHQNWPSRLGCRAVTDRHLQNYRQTTWVHSKIFCQND